MNPRFCQMPPFSDGTRAWTLRYRLANTKRQGEINVRAGTEAAAIEIGRLVARSKFKGQKPSLVYSSPATPDDLMMTELGGSV